MTRRRRLITIITAATGAVLIGAGSATAVLVLTGDDPAPVAADPAPVAAAAQDTPEPEPTVTDLDGVTGCRRLFSGDVLDMPQLTGHLEANDADGVEAVNDWVWSAYNAGNTASLADDPQVSRSGEDLASIVDAAQTGDDLGDLVVSMLDPVLDLAVACVDAGLVEQELIDKWADILEG